jgi:uncharacterized protein (TIGR00730 family)
MEKVQKSVCVFCGSSSGRNPAFIEAAKDLGALLAQRNFRLVYGGGHVGLMGLVADACLQMGGEVIGVIPKALQQREVAHNRLTDLRVVESMHERKALMEQLSDIIVALPGGFGTLDELNEIITWKQLGFHQMPIYILNIDGYYDDFIKFLRRSVADGFISQDHLNYLEICNSVQDFNHSLAARF